MKPLRITLSAVAAIVGALFLYAALTVPMVAAAGPAILAVATLVLAFFLYPRKRKPA
jgi:hypothetical protein